MIAAWPRADFRWLWRWNSRPRSGRPPVNRDLIRLIRRMWQVSPTGSSRRIQTELAKLGLPRGVVYDALHPPVARSEKLSGNG